MGVHMGAAYGFVPRTAAGPRGIGGRNFRYRQRPIYVYRRNACLLSISVFQVQVWPEIQFLLVALQSVLGLGT